MTSWGTMDLHADSRCRAVALHLVHSALSSGCQASERSGTAFQI